MPTQFFRETCEHANSCALSTVDRCRTCGAPNEFLDWRRTRYEVMALYQYVYGLKATGPHRRMSDELLDPHRIRCEACEGRGILSIDRDHWRFCTVCEGTGALWDCAPEEVDRLRALVLDQYPEAGVARTFGTFTGEFIQNLRTGEVVSVDQWRRSTAEEDPEDRDEEGE